ncbi:MAG: tRNA (N(6)-L-threonylcarbamoyladenosine(37)-C(2))-methylthiotransferase [Nanobdellota archaeon]
MSKVYFFTQGCSANVADSEIMAGRLKESGFTIVDDAESSDIIILNSCAVKGPTISTFRRTLKEFEKMEKPIVVAGCLPQAEQDLSILGEHSVVGLGHIDRIVEVVEETLNGSALRVLTRESASRLNKPKVRNNYLVEIVPISEGCMGNCAYCKTKLAKGDLVSYPEEDIVRHVKRAVRDGVLEVWITSQDTSIYGKDIGTNIVNLLKRIISIPGSFRVRLGMANPKPLLGFLDEFSWVMKNEKMYSFLHIPVQSGSNEVLKDMGRDYSVEDFKFIIRHLREEIPDITIATDIICGYPTESEEQFRESYELVKKIRPDVLNISRFWPMEGTRAAKLKPLDGGLVKSRSSSMTKLYHKIAREKNESWIGWKGPVYITERGKNNEYVGHNHSYKQVVVPCRRHLMGEIAEVKAVDADTFAIHGKLQ